MMGMVRHRHALPFNNVFQVKKPIMDDSRLARYLGYAFSQAVHLQHVLAPEELTVPYVVYWDPRSADASPVPGHNPSGGSRTCTRRASAASGRHRLVERPEGWLDLGNGTKAEVLLIEGWVPGLEAPLEMFVYYRREPFRLVQGFLWKDHPQAAKTGPRSPRNSSEASSCNPLASSVCNVSSRPSPSATAQRDRDRHQASLPR